MAATKRNMIIADGKRTGKNAASWCFDGNTKDETYKLTLEGIESGDPKIMDHFRVPNLSGEFADDPTPQSIAEQFDITDDDKLDEYCNLWEDAAQQAFWNEIERICRYQTAA